MKRRILSILLAFCMTLALLPGTALAADSGTCGNRGDNVKWELSSAGILTISGSGYLKSEGAGRYPWTSDGIKGSVASAEIQRGINEIPNAMFYKCENLTRVTIADTVNSIADIAFVGCTNLLHIVIPDSVTSIGESAFENCTRLSKVQLSKGMTTIASRLFYKCSSLSAIIIPDAVTAIGQSSFEGCSKLNSVTIPRSVVAIGNNAFKDCSNLTTVKIMGSSSALGKNAFEGCSNLITIDLPQGIDTLNDGLFSRCSNLTSIAIPDSVEVIGANVFNNCYQLKDIYFSGTQAEWNNIYIDESNNGLLSTVSIHYNSGGTSQPTSYTVTFDPNGGSVSTETKTYTVNAALGTLPTPTRTGYKFNGWYTAETGGTKVTTATKVTADMTLYARWTKNAAKTYTITLNANGGKVSPTSIKVESGKTYLSQLPTPTRAGYKFDGWYTTKTGATKITAATKATGNRTIYAHWTRGRTYLTVNFDPNGGTVYQDMKLVISGNSYKELPTPTRPNYIFKGWYTARTGGKKVTGTTRSTLTGSQTLYAQWQTTATAKTTAGKWTVSVPPYFELPLYSTATTAKVGSIAPEKGVYQDIACTRKAVLSTGVVRYYGMVNGKNVWFTYSCEMDVA